MFQFVKCEAIFNRKKNKEILDLFLRKSEKCLCENQILSLVLLAIEEK